MSHPINEISNPLITAKRVDNLLKESRVDGALTEIQDYAKHHTPAEIHKMLELAKNLPQVNDEFKIVDSGKKDMVAIVEIYRVLVNENTGESSKEQLNSSPVEPFQLNRYGSERTERSERTAAETEARSEPAETRPVIERTGPAKTPTMERRPAETRPVIERIGPANTPQNEHPIKRD